MNAREYYIEEILPNDVTFDEFSGYVAYNANDMIEFAEDYHKQKLANEDNLGTEPALP